MSITMKTVLCTIQQNYQSTHEEVRDAALFLHCALKEEREAATAANAAAAKQ